MGVVSKVIKKGVTKKRKRKTPVPAAAAGGKGKNGKATQKGLRFRKDYVVEEGASRDPVTGGSVRAARKGDTGKVSTGSGQKGLTEGTATGSGWKASRGRQGRVKRKTQLEVKKQRGTITAAEQTELTRLRKSMAKSDAEATARQGRKDVKGQQRAIEQGKKRRGKPKTSDADHMKQTGEIREGYNPTPREIQVAITNAQSRKETGKVRRLRAMLEEMRKRKPGETAIGGYRGSTGTTRSSAYTKDSGGGSKGTGTRGMRTSKYSKGGLIGMGAALRGGGAVRKRGS